MLKPLNKESAFAAIAEDLELSIVLLSSLDPRVRLAMLDKIGAALLSTNLSFRDLAERVVAPRTAELRTDTAAPSLLSTMPLQPRSEIAVDPAAVLSNEELRAYGGYRTAPVSHAHEAGADASTEFADPKAVSVEAELEAFGYRVDSAPSFGRYGYGPIPDECETIPGESVEDAGQRLCLWAMAKSGQPFYEDPATGRGYLPGMTVPGRGKVRPDGTVMPGAHDANTLAIKDELHAFGYRSNEPGYGYQGTPIPGADTAKPTAG